MSIPLDDLIKIILFFGSIYLITGIIILYFLFRKFKITNYNFSKLLYIISLSALIRGVIYLLVYDTSLFKILISFDGGVFYFWGLARTVIITEILIFLFITFLISRILKTDFSQTAPIMIIFTISIFIIWGISINIIEELPNNHGCRTTYGEKWCESTNRCISTGEICITYNAKEVVY